MPLEATRARLASSMGLMEFFGIRTREESGSARSRIDEFKGFLFMKILC